MKTSSFSIASLLIFLLILILFYIIYIYHKHTTNKKLEEHEQTILIKVSNIGTVLSSTSVSLINKAIINVSNMVPSNTKTVLSTIMPSELLKPPETSENTYNNMLTLPKAMYPLTSYYDEQSKNIVRTFDIKDRQRINNNVTIPESHSMPCYEDEIAINGMCYKQCPVYKYDDDTNPTKCVYTTSTKNISVIPVNSSIHEVSNVIDDKNVSFHPPPCFTDENIINGMCYKQCDKYSTYDNKKYPKTCVSLV